jgi:transcriptional regulator with XRE-family HTH domain
MRRESGDLTQDEVSNRAGIKRQYYCSLEAGGKGNQITLVTAVNFSKALNVSLDEFISNEKEYKMKCERENKARKIKRAEIKKS